MNPGERPPPPGLGQQTEAEKLNSRPAAIAFDVNNDDQRQAPINNNVTLKPYVMKDRNDRDGGAVYYITAMLILITVIGGFAYKFQATQPIRVDSISLANQTLVSEGNAFVLNPETATDTYNKWVEQKKALVFTGNESRVQFKCKTAYRPVFFSDITRQMIMSCATETNLLDRGPIK